MRPSEKIYNGIISPYLQITFGIPIKYMSPEMFPGIDGTFYVDAIGDIFKISERGISKLKTKSIIIENLSESESDSQYNNVSIPFKYPNGAKYNRTMKAHRIECMMFKPIPGCKTESDYDDYQVDHKDGNKRNNNINNLEFVTQSENMKRAYKLGLAGKNRKRKES